MLKELGARRVMRRLFGGRLEKVVRSHVAQRLQGPRDGRAARLRPERQTSNVLVLPAHQT